MTMKPRMLRGVLCAAMLGAFYPATAFAQTPACAVDYKINGQWPTGFSVTVTMNNPTNVPIQPWRIAWTMPGTERITDLFNGAVTQTGAAVSVTNLSYNGTIPARGNVTFGFNAMRTSATSVPAAFRINDMACSGGSMPPVSGPTMPPASGFDALAQLAQVVAALQALAALGTPIPAPTPTPAPAPNPLAALTDFNGPPLTLLSGLRPVNSPTNNPQSPEKVELGKLLFFDTRLSMGGQFSCAVCHMPEKGWGDGIKVSTRDNATVNTRHSPTLFNVFYSFPTYYWDGRQPTLESVSNAAWTGQMGGVPDKVATDLALVPEYKDRFTRVFGSGPTGTQIPMALAAFIRTIQSGDSPWDRFLAGDRTAVSADVVAGEAIFRRSNCTNCHVQPLYSDYKFHNIGVGFQGVAMPDLGRGAITKNAAENGAFKTPTLRGVALHSPHFHDGSAKTLEEAVDFMLAGGYRGPENPNIDELLKPSTVTPTERLQLLAFLRALSGVNRPFTRPTPPAGPSMGGTMMLSSKELYDGMCSVCHGTNGKGIGGFPDVTVSALTPTYPTRQALIDKIARTMPTSRPGSCTGECAARTADYILATFNDVVAGGGGTTNPGGGTTTPGGGTTTPGGGTTTPGGGTTTPGGGTGGTPTPAPVVCNGETPGPRVLRLLTRREYENTVMDLLGVSSPFSFSLPAAARVLGYDNNTDLNVITARHIDGYLQTAQDLATRALQSQRGRLVPCDPNANAAGCAQQIVRDLGKRAYRRPLDPTEQAQLAALFTGVSFDEGVKRAVTAMLVSPNFLYRTEIGTPAGNGTVRLTQYEIASALSYLFWGTMPDAALFTAADQNALQTPESLVTQANRLLADPKAKRQIGVFAGQWLGADPIDSGDKNPRVYPDYTRAVQDATDAELIAFVNHVIFNGTGKFPELFNANYVFVNQPLAAYYGLPAVNGQTPQQVPVPDGSRGGLLGLGSVLASFAQADDTSPVRRGVFVRRSLLCQTLPPPPPAINNAPPPLDPKLTTRARFAAHSSEPFCASCHQYFDDIGFGLERYDGAGKLRSLEAGVPIDDAGKIVSPENLNTALRPVPAGVPFKGLRQLSSIVGGSADAPKCLATQYFRYARGNEETTTDQCTVQALYNRFQASGFDLKTLLIGIVQSPTFTTRRTN